MTELADEVLSRKPELRAAFEAEYDKMPPILRAAGPLPADRDTYVRQKATEYGLTKRLRRSEEGEGIRCGGGIWGRVATGWDDHLPPEVIDRRVDPI